MKERPILFSAPMVRAILAGRKTQTRRLVKPQPSRIGALGPIANERTMPCPYGQPGDRLWVRETFQVLPGRGLWRDGAQDDLLVWRATCPNDEIDSVRMGGVVERLRVAKWRPSIYMPRWASRITLEVTSVRVERLQDISEEDARAEGVTLRAPPHPSVTTPHRGEFYWLWESINAKNAKRAPWASNPWVWVVEFKLVSHG